MESLQAMKDNCIRIGDYVTLKYLKHNTSISISFFSSMFGGLSKPQKDETPKEAPRFCVVFQS